MKNKTFIKLNKKSFFKIRKAFTLIELLVVVSILGILAAVGIPQYSNYLTISKEKTSTLQCQNIYKKINNEITLLSSGYPSKIIDGFATRLTLQQSPTTMASIFKYHFDEEKFMNPWTSSEVVVEIINSNLDENNENHYGNIAIIGNNSNKTLTLECIIKPSEKTTKTIYIE